MLKVLELFGGVGACTKALKKLGIKFKVVDYVEIDKYAVKSYNAINGTDFEPQDITKWDKDIKVDFIMHGSPCQDFSVAGLGRGGDEGSGTRSSLMYETIRIVKKTKPKYICWENVKNLISEKHIHNFEKYLLTMEELGYNNYHQVLNAKDYGIPQNRERIFTISIRKDIDTNPWGYVFPKPIPLDKTLKDLLDTNVPKKYYLSSKMLSYLTGENQKKSKFPRGERWLSQLESTNTKGVAATISTNAGNRPVDNFILDDVDDMEIIKDMVKKDDLNTVVADTEEESEEHKTWLQNKLEEFYDEHGYIPDILNPFNKAEITNGVIPTLTTSGSPCVRTGIVINESGLIDKKSIKEPEVLGGLGEKKSNGGTQWYEQDRVYDGEKIATSVTAESSFHPYYAVPNKSNDKPKTDTPIRIGNYSPSGHNAASIVDSSGIAPCVMENHGTVTATNEGLKIRKLTPKECWRLMGFDDVDFEKASKVNSDAQLYKQAGNSIVVNCLEAMFRELFSESEPEGTVYEVKLF